MIILTSVVLTTNNSEDHQLNSRRNGGTGLSANGFNLRPSLRVAAKLLLVL